MVFSTNKNAFYRLTKVSRETLDKFEIYEELLKYNNKKLNLISKSTEKSIWDRHFLDSSQVIDFIDKKDKILTDIGTGAGFPGIVVALLAKDRKMKVKIRLLEKSKKKINFLNLVIKELNLNTETINQNVFETRDVLTGDVFMARAFKPIEKILELIHKKADNWKKILVFLGKTGKYDLLQASKNWDIEYKQRMSITSNDSLILEVNKLKKK
jgi:16S rRNA (guanine527-N7)-methyltransferase